jgi:hypothetical protein
LSVPACEPTNLCFVLGLPVETVVKAIRLDLAESALHAPQAGWGGVDFYPTLR